MALINISIDTADKAKTKIAIDGKAIKNVYSVYIYSIDDPTYMSVEINQHEKIDNDEAGTLRKFTKLVAGEKEFEVKDFETKTSDDYRLALAEALLGREIESGV